MTVIALRQLLFVMVVSVVQVVCADKYADWSVNIASNQDFLFAATVNDSGALLGQFCYTDEAACLWLLTSDSSCEKNVKYPALINSDGGAFLAEFVCQGQIESRQRFGYAFANFEQMNHLIASATKVGIAFPLQGDQFRVMRFSLRGAQHALNKMHSEAERLMKKNQRTTRDIFL